MMKSAFVPGSSPGAPETKASSSLCHLSVRRCVTFFSRQRARLLRACLSAVMRPLQYRMHTSN